MLSCIFQLHCQKSSSQLRSPRVNSTTTALFSPRSSATSRATGSLSSSGYLSSSWQDIGSNFPHTAGGGGNGTISSGVMACIEDDEKALEEKTHRQNCLLLDSLLIRQGDEYRRCYANILYRWELLEQRAEVIKLQSTTNEDHTRIGQARNIIIKAQ